MIKRIEFHLNLAEPHDAAIYRALRPSLRHRRAGSVIRLALLQHLIRAAHTADVQQQKGDPHDAA